MKYSWILQSIVGVFKGGCPTRGAPLVCEFSAFCDDKAMSSFTSSDEAEFLEGDLDLGVVKAKPF